MIRNDMNTGHRNDSELAVAAISQVPRTTLRLAHSPDPDDAFMWWPLFELDGRPSRINTGRFMFKPVELDIQTLNERSLEGDLEITALSCAQYPHVRHRYAITSCGSSMGEAYGPRLVARRPMRIDELLCPSLTVAVPGARTSAFAAMTIMLLEAAGLLDDHPAGGSRHGNPPTPPASGSRYLDKPFRYVAVPFEQIIDRVAEGEFEVGLIIHEGQLTYQHAGLHLVCDLGAWWTSRHALPLPLGLNVVRRDLDHLHGPGTLGQIAGLLLESVRYAMDHRAESVAYAMRFAREMSTEVADEFIGMYVNRLTLDFGDRGREAVRVFLERTHHAGLSPATGPIDLVEPATMSA